MDCPRDLSRTLRSMCNSPKKLPAAFAIVYGLGGERIPSVRQLCRERGLSAATAIRAHELLEDGGYIESVPRSGRFVSDSWRERAVKPQPLPETPHLTPIDVGEIAFRLLDSVRDRNVVPFGSPFPSPELFPLAKLDHALRRRARRLDPWRTVQDLDRGSLELRQRIAQRYLRHGARVSPDEIIITSGALEALNLCLQAVARPGDSIAIETPTFYGCLNALEAYGLRALEIPTHPKYGVDLDALRHALDGAPVRACWFMTAFQNPLGSSVPAAAKRELVKLLEARNVPLIEDNVYGELHYGLCRRSRPKRLIGVAWCLNAAHSRSAWRRATASAGWRRVALPKQCADASS